jgi:hypothetical protein
LETRVGSSGVGARKLMRSRLPKPAFMNSIQMGSAALAPVSFSPRDLLSSNPIHTPQVREGETYEPCISKVIGGSRLARERVLHAARCDGGSMRDHLSKHRGHNTRRAFTHDLLNFRVFLLQYGAIVVGDLTQVSRNHANFVVRKCATGGCISNKVRSTAPRAMGRCNCQYCHK